MNKKLRPDFLFLVLALLLAIVCPIQSLGQAISGNLAGTIADPTGAAVVNADVEITNVATNIKTTTKSNETGEYRFTNLPVGDYILIARAPGFAAVSRHTLVELNKTGTVNMTMTPGKVTETVEVSGQTVTIDTTTAQIQSTFSPKELADLPLTSVGSGVINLSLLNAGVSTQGGIGLGTGPSISGQRPRNNNFTVEGVDNNNKSVTGPLLQLPNDSVDQFTVLQNQFSPEFGHSSGGQFNQTIKAGSNSFHGRLYEYFQNRNLNAQDSQVALSQVSQGLAPFNTRYDNNRFGGQFGGPIKKDKLFFFTNWEYNPVGQVTSSTACGPTAAGYTALAALTEGGVNANNVTQFQTYAGVAPTQALSSDLNCAPTTSVLGNDIPIGAIGYSGANYQNILTGVFSMDWNLSDRDQLRGRYSYEKYDLIDYYGQIPTFWTVVPQRFHLLTLSEYHNFTPHLNNEFRVGFNRYSNDYPAGNFSFPGLDQFPNLIIGFGEGAGVQIGPDPNSPQFGTQNFYQVVDNLSWVKGNHTFKFGAEYREYISPQGFTQRQRGDYDYTTFAGYFTDQVPDYLAERSIGSVTYYGNQNMFYGFASDEWRLRKNLSINLGLRYEFTQVPLAQRQWQPLNAISNVPGLVTFGAPTAQKKNFLPRLGIAWSPGSSGNTSIRAGYAMSQDVLYDNLGILSGPPQVQQTCDAPGPQTGSCFWSDTGFLAGGGLPYSATIPPITNPDDARAATGSFIPNQKLPYSETWTLGIQHLFAQKYSVEVRYVGTRGLHLPVQARLNRQAKTSASLYLPTFFSDPGQTAIDALTTTYDQINSNSSFVPAWADGGFTGSNVVGFMPWGSSKYHGLQTQVRRNFTNGLQFQAAWTWSHAMDDSTADVFSTYITPRRPQDFQCISCDWSDSALDRRHRFTLQFLYDMPFFKHDNSWTKKNLLGNWEVAPIYTFQSSEFATVQSGLDINGNGDSAGDRSVINPAGIRGTGTAVTPLCTSGLIINDAGPCDPAGNPNSLPYVVGYLANSSTAYYVGADTDNGWGKYMKTTSRRNTLVMPHTNNFDLTILKRVNITERQSFEFQAQMLNLFNHAQYLPGYISDVQPGAAGYTSNSIFSMLVPSSPTFNQPKSVFSNHPRQMVLVLKYNF